MIRLLIFLVLALALFVVTLSLWHKELILSLASETAEANVTRRLEVRGRRHISHYKIWYEYTDAGGVVHIGEGRLSRNEPWQDHPLIARQVTVVYSPWNPSISCIYHPFLWGAWVLVIVSLSAFSWLLLVLVKTIRRHGRKAFDV